MNRFHPLFVILALWALSAAGCKESEQPSKPATPSTPAAPSTPDKPGSPSTPPAPTGQLPAVPLGLDPVAIPADNPMTEAKVELGKMLYFDKRLSKENDISCATCHDPSMAWAEKTTTSKGIRGQMGDRNAPTVVNAAYMRVQFWDGRAASLEQQAVGPIQNPIEMGNTLEACVDCLNKIPEYKKLFKDVFGTEINKEGVAKAIAAFERTILSGNSPYDKATKGNDKAALTDAQKRGMDLFMDKGQCSTCHSPPMFSNSGYYNAGAGKSKDEGRKKVTSKDGDLGKFRVPGLREAANTAPYFHDGGVATLEEAVKLMATGGVDNPNLSSTFKGIRDAKLTEADIKDLVEFVKALSGDYPKMQPPKLPG